MELSLSALAQEMGVNRQTAGMWITRRHTNGFPLPVRRGICERARKHGRWPTDLYDLEQVQLWRRTYVPRHGRRPMAESSTRMLGSHHHLEVPGA